MSPYRTPATRDDEGELAAVPVPRRPDSSEVIGVVALAIELLVFAYFCGCGSVVDVFSARTDPRVAPVPTRPVSQVASAVVSVALSEHRPGSVWRSGVSDETSRT